MNTERLNNKICPNCGVILDEGLEKCPLCESVPDGKTGVDDERYPSEILHLSEKKTRTQLWELSAIIAFSANLICIIVDMVIVKGLNWSLYAVTSITGLWLFITAFTFLLKRLIPLGLLLAVTTLAMLLIFDMLNPPVTWFMDIGLPVSVTFWILFGLYMVILRKLRWRGFNMLGYILIEISVLCMVIDIFTDLHLRGSILIDWSAITAATLVPLAGILFFMHYRMKRGKNLRSFFHV
ncbi:MAG: DUF6320 domain-containing protein [Bacteroidales bacterium]|nr:DUF6320 domain-containing protein [Bacteroidales bacterium]